MWLHFTLRDARSISYYLGVILIAEGFAMLIPFVFGCIAGEWEAVARYLFWAGTCGICGTGLRMIRIYPEGLSRQQATMLSGLGWLLVAFMGACPLWMSGHFSSFFNAFFDCIAAFTTTNVSIMNDLDHLSYADNIWRFVMAFSGGIAVVVLALTMGEDEIHSHHDMYYEEGAERILPRAFKVLRMVIRVMLITIATFAILQTVLLLFHGFAPLRAAYHGSLLAISASTTSGLSPMQNGIMYYHSWPVAFLLIVATLFAGINLRIRIRVFRGRVGSFLHDTATRAAGIWWLLLLVVFISSLVLSSSITNIGSLITTGIFEFFAAATTSGFSIINVQYNPQVMPSGSLLALCIVTAIGASSGSTTGGVQLERLVVVAKSSVDTIHRAISPDSARHVIVFHRLGRRIVGERLIQTSMLMFILYIAMYTVGALAGVSYGYDAVSALSQSITMASNAGLNTAIDLTQAPDPLKVIYLIEMWLGRLGVIPMLGIMAKLVFTISASINRSIIQRARNRS